VREQKALVCRIEDKVLLFGAGTVGNKAASFQTNDRLLHTLVVTFKLTGIIHVEDTLDLKRDHALDHGEATTGVLKGFQIN
jgi:hypothetical protein